MATTESSPSGHPITTDPTTIAGDPFAWAGRRLEEARRGLSERRTEAELVEAVREEEDRRGYPMSYGEREECPCPDFEFHGGSFACKHVLAVGISVAKRRGATLRSLTALEDQLQHELMEDRERQELRDRVLRLRRRLGR